MQPTQTQAVWTTANISQEWMPDNEYNVSFYMTPLYLAEQNISSVADICPYNDNILFIIVNNIP